MHQPSGGIGGTASDIQIQAEQMLHMKKQLAELIAEHTGQTVEQIEADSDRDRWFTADAGAGVRLRRPRRRERRRWPPAAAAPPEPAAPTTAPDTFATYRRHADERQHAVRRLARPRLGACGRRLQTPSSRYILPQFEERTSYGFKRLDPYTKLFEDRIIFLGVQVDDASADDIMAQLLVLESQDPDRDIITLHQLARWLVHGADGDLRHDAVHPAGHPDRLPRAGGLGGRGAARRRAPGKRLALPNARVLIHQPAMSGGDYGQASDIEIQANEILRMREWLE